MGFGGIHRLKTLDGGVFCAARSFGAEVVYFAGLGGETDGGHGRFHLAFELRLHIGAEAMIAGINLKEKVGAIAVGADPGTVNAEAVWGRSNVDGDSVRPGAADDVNQGFAGFGLTGWVLIFVGLYGELNVIRAAACGCG